MRTLSLVAIAIVLAPSISAQGKSRYEFVGAWDDSTNDWTVIVDRPSACMTAMSPTNMYRVPIYLDARMPEHTDSSFTLQADLMAQEVASEFRALLGAKGDQIPAANETTAWYAIPSQLVIVAHRDGSMTRHLKTFAGDSSAATTLARAFDSARVHNSAIIAWPENVKVDSVIVRLSIMPTAASSDLLQMPTSLPRVKFAVFSIAEPYLSPASFKAKPGVPLYPIFNGEHRITGQVILEFVVDTLGMVDPATIHDVWNSGKPRLQSELARYYYEFVRNVANWVKKAEYTPARMGPCLVPQIVRFPVKFVTPESQRAEEAKRSAP